MAPDSPSAVPVAPPLELPRAPALIEELPRAPVTAPARLICGFDYCRIAGESAVGCQTVKRCYRGARVHPLTYDAVRFAARRLGYAEPPAPERRGGT